MPLSRTILIFLLCMLCATFVHGSRPKPRPCEPEPVMGIEGPGVFPKYRPGSFPACLGGTTDAPGSGHCQIGWCGPAVLRISPDPIDVKVSKVVTLTVDMQGRLETGGNMITTSAAEVDWGDGST